jgi:16S rRNA processing protein RimM
VPQLGTKIKVERMAAISSTSSPPRRRGARAADPLLALDSRFRGNDDVVGTGKDRVCMGIVGAPHGVRGAVRIKSFTDAPEAIANYGALEDESSERRFTLRIVASAKGDGMVIAKISGVADRDRAEALRGLRLYAPRAALPATTEDEFYHADLVGLVAQLEDGLALGTIIAVHDFGAGDVIEIERAEGQPVLVPFTRAAVPVVDIAGGRVVIDPPDGLFDMPKVREPAA